MANLVLLVWPVVSGDALCIRFTGKDNLVKNIFVDGGFVGTYKNTLKPELISINERNEKVDLWVITHTDSDHVGGLIGFLKDSRFTEQEKLDIVSHYWFNWSDYRLTLSTKKVSASQGIKLREHLKRTGKLQFHDLTVESPPFDLTGLSITLVSPSKESLQKSKVAWSNHERRRISARTTDHTFTIEELSKRPFREDDSPWNGGSLGILVEDNGRRMLLLGDSYPSIIVAELRRRGYSEQNKLIVSVVKLSHHGSAGNTSSELIGLISCNDFLICANGTSNGHPDKVTLARILTHPSREPEQQITFHFNYDNSVLRSLFEADQNAEVRYNFRCHFPSNNDHALLLDFTS